LEVKQGLVLFGFEETPTLRDIRAIINEIEAKHPEKMDLPIYVWGDSINRKTITLIDLSVDDCVDLNIDTL
jgi:hypothetical protein